MSERTRFAPAPTGRLHVGGARTALFSWLVARQSGGAFVLRMEDTDPERVRPGAEEGLMEDLRWLGLDWDEGPDIGGPHAPYRQSERWEAYRAAAERLRASGMLYPCYCTREELAAARDDDVAHGRPPRYPGTCRGLSARMRAQLEAEGRRPAWRFAVPQGQRVIVEDAVHGQIAFSTDDMSDFVVMRSDGRATYDLACVVDDAAMRISLVVRGDDHLANTARQLLLFEALGTSAPRYAHLPLVRGYDGTPLSKSAGGAAIADLRDAGYLASAVIEYVASLGWAVPDGLGVRSASGLLDAFRLEAVSAAPPVHDPKRLQALNKRHLRRLDSDSFAAFAAAFMPPIPSWIDRDALLLAIKDDVDTGREIARSVERIVVAPDPAPEVPGPVADAVRAVLGDSAGQWDPGSAAARLKEEFAVRGVPVKEGMHAVRRALIGLPEGPPVSALFAALGPQETARRLRAASLTRRRASGDSDVP